MLGFPDRSVGKESACNVGDTGSIAGLGRYAGDGTDRLEIGMRFSIHTEAPSNLITGRKAQQPQHDGRPLSPEITDSVFHTP